MMSAKRFVVEILATDGLTIRRVAWVKRQQNGVYLGAHEKGRNVHLSYHTDGSQWHNWEGRPKRTRIGAPLDSISGCVQLVSIGLSKDLQKVSQVPYRGKRIDAAIFIDTRKFTNADIGLNIYLIQPRNVSAFSLFVNPPDKFNLAELHVIYDVSPWVAIEVYYVQNQ